MGFKRDWDWKRRSVRGTKKKKQSSTENDCKETAARKR
jgi:hypothetical protein